MGTHHGVKVQREYCSSHHGFREIKFFFIAIGLHTDSLPAYEKNCLQRHFPMPVLQDPWGLTEIWCGKKKRIHGQISLGNALFNFSTQCWQPAHEIFQWHGKQCFPVCWRQTSKASPGMAEASALQICSGTSGFLHSWWTHSTMGKEASIGAAGLLLQDIYHLC